MKHTLDWNQYLSLAAQAVAEGIVLLRNETNALPLPADEQIALFGRSQLHYYKSGTGSGGMVNVAKVTGILEGLLEAGVRVYEPLLNVYREWDAVHPYDLGSGWGGEPWSQEEMPLDDTLVQDASGHCRRAIVIIGRTAGEEQDNRAEAGSFLLTDTEKVMLSQTRAYFEKVIVLLNTGNLIDLSFIDLYKPDAVLCVWQGGMTGGTGTAAVLTGKVSPSGKLTDTAALSLSDYPSDSNFHGKEKNIYAEDIYVGYRYFETFALDKVRFPFGFGLSYTSFSVQADSLGGDTPDRLILNVTVKNTGRRPGKEVIQVYCEAPQGKLGKPSKQLIAFRKTDIIEAEQSESLLIPVRLPLSYDDSGVSGFAHAWVRESGEYRYYVGTDVRSAVYCGSYSLQQTECVQQCTQAMGPVEPFQRMKPIRDKNSYILSWESTPLNQIDEAQRRIDNLPNTVVSDGQSFLLKDVLEERCSLSQFVAQLSDTELCQIVRGEGMGSPRVTAGTASAFGGVTDALTAFGIPASCCSDGPSGMRLDCGTKAFSLPNGTMLASTFNPDLITDLFTCVGLEMTANHVDCLLGPGMNIHRHPLNGRNFEYFSEDPLLTGEIASAVLSGLHKAGVEGTIKHCCGNNQETNRHFLDSVVSERALREIYLEGFRIAVQKGCGKSIMTTYGSVNGLWTAGNFDLCTQIIRKEWGYDGFLMTDWWANINERGKSPDRNLFAAMVRAQNDVYMVCADSAEHEDDLEESLANGVLTRAELQRSAENICRFLLHTHAMQRMIGKADEIEIMNRPSDEADSGEPVEFFDLTDGTVISMERICTDKGTNHAFALTVSDPGWYRVTLTASSDQSELAQIPVTLFSMGTASGTFTWNGTEGKPVSFHNNLPIFSHYTAMRLYFAQSGLKMISIRFDKIAGVADVANMTNLTDDPT